MHVHVKLTSQKTEADCSSCGRGGIQCIQFLTQVEDGFDEGAPICLGCLVNGVSLTAIIEQPDMRPGARAPDKRMQRRSRRQELDIAEKTGGRRHKASGALPGLKGDARKKGIYRAEGKLCTHKAFRLDLEILNKIRSEADYNEVPAVVVTFIDKHTLQERDCWVAVPWATFEEKIANAADHDQ